MSEKSGTDGPCATVEPNISRTTAVKAHHTSRDNWISFEPVNGRISSFLLLLSALGQKPPEEIVPPDFVCSRTAEIESEMPGVDKEEKLTSIFSVRDKVHRTKSTKHYWNLSELIEMRSANVRCEHDKMES